MLSEKSIVKINSIVTSWKAGHFILGQRKVKALTKSQLCELLTVQWQAGTDYILWSNEKKYDFEVFVQDSLDNQHNEV